MLAKRSPAAGLERAGIIVLVTAVLLVAGVRSAGAAEGWRVQEQPAMLQYRLAESADWARASPGMELQPGTTVRAGSGRPAVLSQDGNSIVLRGGTELTLPPTGTETVVQRLGSARYQIEPGSVADFLVETPYLVIGIKGTVFEVLVNEAGTKVGVSEGRVEVRTPDGRFRAELAPGQTARARAALGSALEVQSESGGNNAPAPQDQTESAPPDQAAISDVASPPTQAEVDGAPTQAEVDGARTQAELGGVLSPVTSVTRSLLSGLGGLLSGVDVVYDDRLPPRRPGTLVRTLSGGIASIGSGARGDSGGGSGAAAAGGSSSSGAGTGSGGSSSGDAGGGSSGSGSGGGGRGGGGLGGAVGGVSSAVGGAVGGVSSAVGGAAGGSLGSAVGSVGRGVGSAVGGLGRGLGGALGGGGRSGGGKSRGGKSGGGKREDAENVSPRGASNSAKRAPDWCAREPAQGVGLGPAGAWLEVGRGRRYCRPANSSSKSYG
jgi:FecR protein